MEEIWKDIKGYEGIYQVSNLGRVRSLDRVASRVMPTGKVFNSHKVPGRMLKNNMSNIGYYVVNLHKDGKGHTMQVHRLVAQAFIPNPDHLPEVNHKDENKQNNVVSNLEWCTDKYNVNYGTGLSRRADTQRNDPDQSKPVIQYTKDGQKVAEYPSIREAVRQTGIKKDTISRSCRGLQKYCHKFYFRFKD